MAVIATTEESDAPCRDVYRHTSGHVNKPPHAIKGCNSQNIVAPFVFLDKLSSCISGDLTLVGDLVARHEAANAGVQGMQTMPPVAEPYELERTRYTRWPSTVCADV